MDDRARRIAKYGQRYLDREADLLERFKIGQAMYPEVTIAVQFPLDEMGSCLACGAPVEAGESWCRAYVAS